MPNLVSVRSHLPCSKAQNRSQDRLLLHSSRAFANRVYSLDIQDSLNANECLIVYNDSTVFEYDGGVFGVQHFVGKEEYMAKRRK